MIFFPSNAQLIAFDQILFNVCMRRALNSSQLNGRETAVIAGGCLRDILLNRHVSDIDVP